MRAKTVQQLNQINTAFYNSVAESFDNSRSYSWSGWERLWSMLLENGEKPDRVLDLGCGNGRFLQLLKSKDWVGECVGIDNNQYLLDKARSRLSGENVKFIHADLLTYNPAEDERGFDLIVAFGVMHHIPGYTDRVQFIKRSLSELSENGIAAFTFWQFKDDERYEGRLISPQKVGIDPKELEECDYFLDWKGDNEAIRYCHFVDEAEADKLIAESGSEEISRFYADGRSGRLNLYLVLQ